MKIENGKMVSVTYELKYDDADAKLIEVCDKSCCDVGATYAA